jgi:hypothetical protein
MFAGATNAWHFLPSDILTGDAKWGQQPGLALQCFRQQSCLRSVPIDINALESFFLRRCFDFIGCDQSIQREREKACRFYHSYLCFRACLLEANSQFSGIFPN